MGHENEYTFEDANDHKVKKSKFSGVGSFIWNSRTKEFLGRDGASWGKVSLFYAIFYLGLGSFFIGMLAVFIQIMPKDKPTYYGESSVMNSRGLNPGLGFRPQVDVEDSLIYYNPQVYEDSTQGHKKYVRNLKNFLDASELSCFSAILSPPPPTPGHVFPLGGKLSFQHVCSFIPPFF